MIKIITPFVMAAMLLAACSSNNSDELNTDNPDVSLDPVTDGDWYRPMPGVTWQWQLQGAINTGYMVDLYDVDLFDVPQQTIDLLHAQGRRVICYFSAGSFEGFRDDASQFNDADKGNTLDGFADERWLDIRSANVAQIMLQRLDLAEQKNCDGVEPDNMDGYTNNSGFALSADDQLVFNRLIANEAHNRNLSVALKNDLDQIPQLVAYYDFSVNEQCHEFDECALLTPFIDAGKAVLNAEYRDDFVNNTLSARDQMCVDSISLNLSSLVLPLDLDDAFRFSCL